MYENTSNPAKFELYRDREGRPRLRARAVPTRPRLNPAAAPMSDARRCPPRSHDRPEGPVNPGATLRA